MTFKEYLEEHSISIAQAAKFGLRESKDTRYGAQLVIPIKDEAGKILFNKYRSLESSKENKIPKYTFDLGTHETTFNAPALSKPGLVIFEGEIDTIRADQEGIPGISGTNGAASIPEEWEEKLAGKELYICYDTDRAGVEAIYKLAEKFPKAKVITLPSKYKDTSEYFKEHPKQDFVDLMKIASPIDEWTVNHPKEEYRTHTLADLLTREYPKESWIIDKFLPAEGIVIFSGDAGVGKSFLLLEIVRAMVDNDIFLDHFEIKTPNVPILVIDKENGARRLQRRIKGLGIPPTNKVHFLEFPEKFNLTDAEFLQAVQNFIIVNKVGMVLLDSFIDILEGDENSAPDTAAIFNKLREIAPNILWVILHHESKPMPRFQREVIDRARGSSNIKAQVDYLFSLQKTKTPKVINIEQGKARDYEVIKPFSIEFITTEDTLEMGGFKYLGEVKSELSKVEEAADFVMNFLGLTPNQSRQAIIDAGEGRGVAESSIKRAIQMLKEKKLLESTPDPLNKRKQLFSILEVIDEPISDDQLRFNDEN